MKFSPSSGGFYDEKIHGSNIPDDAIYITDERHAELLTGQSAGQRIIGDINGSPILQNPPPPSQEEVVKAYEDALDNHLDRIARAHRYDNRITFSLRAGYAGPYQNEGIAYAQWMDACYLLSNQIKNAVIAGQQAMPTIEDFIEAMPDFVLP